MHRRATQLSTAERSMPCARVDWQTNFFSNCLISGSTLIICHDKHWFSIPVLLCVFEICLDHRKKKQEKNYLYHDSHARTNRRIDDLFSILLIFVSISLHTQLKIARGGQLFIQVREDESIGDFGKLNENLNLMKCRTRLSGIKEEGMEKAQK